MKKILTTVIAAVLFVSSAAAIDFSKIETNLDLTVDFAYYPLSDYVPGNTHFAPITGPYSGVEGRAVLGYGVTIPTPLGDHWLVSDANVCLTPKLEITPISVQGIFDLCVTPLPFLYFNAGYQVGTGWSAIGLNGVGFWDDSAKDYKGTPGALITKWYADGTFQFDFGVVFPGDWTHVQFVYNYEVYCMTNTTADKGDNWYWQGSGRRANSLKNYQSIILAYALPNPVITRVGVMTEIEGFYSATAFDQTKFAGYNSAFKGISISPLAQFQFGEKDSLSFLLGFSSRQSFKEAHTDENLEFYLTQTGREWFFNRIAFSYNHKF